MSSFWCDCIAMFVHESRTLVLWRTKRVNKPDDDAIGRSAHTLDDIFARREGAIKCECGRAADVRYLAENADCNSRSDSLGEKRLSHRNLPRRLLVNSIPGVAGNERKNTHHWR